MKKGLLFLVFVFYFELVYSQAIYKIESSSTITISGTSTIHDWTSKVNTIHGILIFAKTVNDKTISQNGKLVESLKIDIPVKSIESSHGAVMDNKTYEALKSDDYPTITFILKDNNIIGVVDKTSNNFKLNTVGDLTIAGFTKTISITIDGQRMDPRTFQFEGNYSFKMTDYKVQPPTAMFGQIVTGDKITIVFKLIISKK